MQIPGVTAKSYGVFGLGKTGIATAQALMRSGTKVYVWDDGDAANDIAFSVLHGAHVQPIDTWPWQALEGLVLSPGVPLTHPKPHAVVLQAKQHDVPIMGDVELLYRANPKARFIAITGTNGKSTTTSLIGHILNASGNKVQVGGNLGVPVLALEPLGENGIYVLELSSYQLELLHTTRFHVAVWLNISPDHLDRHGTMENYIAAKAHIFDRQQHGDVAVIGVDDAASEATAHAQIDKGMASVVPISVTQKPQHGVYAHHAALHDARDASVAISLEDIPTLRGQHNAQNAAAAFAACKAAGLDAASIAAHMRSFPGLAHRMQWLGEIDGVGFVNDSKATNADAAEKALTSYDTIYWVLGGVAKAGGIAPLGKYFHRIKHAFLIGEAAHAFAETLGAQQVSYSHHESLEVATRAAFVKAKADGAASPVVMLSPACASFDQFANFEARGDMFVRVVNQLRTGGADAA